MNSVLYLCLVAACLSVSNGEFPDGNAKTPTPFPSGTAKARSEIRKALFADYDRVNIPDNANVKFGMSLLNLDVDEDKGTIEADVWFRMGWKDDRLQWDNVSTGVSALRVGTHEIWKPDITLYNSASVADMASCWDSMPIIMADGSALWVPPCHINAYCNFTLDEQPLGEQSCKFKFGSWVYDGLLMDIQLYENSAKADVDYFGSRKWEIVSNTATRTAKYYPCCAEPYPDITFDLKIKRITKDKNQCKN